MKSIATIAISAAVCLWLGSSAALAVPQSTAEDVSAAKLLLKDAVEHALKINPTTLKDVTQKQHLLRALELMKLAQAELNGVSTATPIEQ